MKKKERGLTLQLQQFLYHHPHYETNYLFTVFLTQVYFAFIALQQPVNVLVVR